MSEPLIVGRKYRRNDVFSRDLFVKAKTEKRPGLELERNLIRFRLRFAGKEGVVHNALVEGGVKTILIDCFIYGASLFLGDIN